MSRLLKFSWWWYAAACLLTACMSPVVGLECKDGYGRCGHACYDFSSDPQHCGGCNMACEPGNLCIEGVCSEWGGDGDGSVGWDAGPPLPPVCSGEDPPDDCVCDIGQIKCGNTCRDADSDPDHCGACDNRCDPGGFCVGGACYPSCEAPLVQCGQVCADLERDFRHCGQCGRSCESGICIDGECVGRTAGHVVAIGHDLSSRTPSTTRLLGNAVFLPIAETVRVLMFDEKTREGAKDGVMTALESIATRTGRSYEVTTTSSLAVTFLLGMSDVFVIQAQALAEDSALIKNGESWGRALRSFVRRGGVIVLLEGPGGNNAGTYQILRAAGLFSADGRVAIGRKVLNVVAPGDAIATQVPSMYQGGAETVGFDTNASTVVIRDADTNTPVVVHIAVQ